MAVQYSRFPENYSFLRIQDQKICLKFFSNSSFSQLLSLEMLINIKTRHFHNSINHQECLFHITHITSYFRPVNIAKFLRAAFLQNTSRSSRLQMFFKLGVLRSFANFTGKHLCWSPFLKNSQAGGLQLHKKRLQHSCFPVQFAKLLKTLFLQNTSRD